MWIEDINKEVEAEINWCLKCVYKPCLCILTRLEERLEEIKNQKLEEYRSEDCQSKLEVPDQAELPGQGSSPHILGENPEILGGVSPGWGGAYHEILFEESNAPCIAGLLAEPKVEGGSLSQGVQDEEEGSAEGVQGQARGGHDDNPSIKEGEAEKEVMRTSLEFKGTGGV